MKLLQVTDLVEKVAANPVTFLVFNSIIAVGIFLKAIDQTNLFISIITADLMLLLLIGQRVGMMAMQKKMDELIRVTDKARDDLAGVEAKGEKVIHELDADEH